MFKKIVLTIALLAFSAASAWAMPPIRISGTAMGLEGQHDVLVKINGASYGVVPQVKFVNGAYSIRLAEQIASYTYNPLNIITLSTTSNGNIFLNRRLDMVIGAQSMFGDAIEPEDLDMTQEYNFKSDVRIGTGENSVLIRPVTTSGKPTITTGYVFATTGLGIDTNGDGLVSTGDVFGVNATGNVNANDIVAAGNITGNEITGTKLTAPTVMATNLTATGTTTTGTLSATTFTTGSLVASLDDDAISTLTINQAGASNALVINGTTTANADVTVNGAVATKGLMITGIVSADDSDGDNMITVAVTPSTSIIRITTGSDLADDQLVLTGGTPGQIIVIYVDAASVDALRWDPATVLSGATMMLTIDPDRWEIINF